MIDYTKEKHEVSRNFNFIVDAFYIFNLYHY